MVTVNIYHSFALPQFGALEKRRPASFLLVEGRPWRDIRELKNEKRVWKEGVEIQGS